MGKNLKDIVDEGFSQLAVLAGKRLEILARAEMIGSAASGSRGIEAEQQIRTSELGFLDEMNERVEQLLHELRQTLFHVSENSASFQLNATNNLKMQLTGMLSDVEQSKAFLLNGARARLDALLHELEKEFETDGRLLTSEVSRLVAPFERLSQTHKSALYQSQTEIAAKIALSEHDVNAVLGKAFDQVTQGVDTKRHEIADALENLYRKQLEKLESSYADLNVRIVPIVREQCDKMKESCSAKEQLLKEIRSATYDSALEELNGASKEPLQDMLSQSEASRKKMSENIEQLKELSRKLLKQEKEALLERSAGIARSAEQVYADLANFENNGGGDGKSRVDEAFTELGLELSGVTDELGVKLGLLLNSQSEGLARLGASTDKVFTDLCDDFKAQLKELLTSQEELCAKKEEALLLQLQKLEEQVSDTYGLLKASGISSKKVGNESGGGS